MASGVYGIRLRCGDIEDIMPIYVLPPVGTATAPIVYLAPTFTYQIYGNHQRGNVDEAFARQAEWRVYPWNAFSGSSVGSQ
jgi:N,N-dimethylformamidase